MHVTRLLHVSVNVDGALATTDAFYRDLFGLQPEARPEIPGVGGRWFGVGTTELHLVDAAPGPGPIRPTGNHFCVAVADIDGAIHELDARGIRYERGAQGDVVQVWIADPAGNTIELQQDRDLA